jgi:hypothetical protein
MNKFTVGQAVRVSETRWRSYETIKPYLGLIGHVVSESEGLVEVRFEDSDVLGNTVFPFRPDQLEVVRA